MNGSKPLPSWPALKEQAKRLRADLEENGTTISHSRSLELLAHQLGFKDWNTLHASAGNRPPPSPVMLGDRVRGTYLGQAFEGDRDRHPHHGRGRQIPPDAPFRRAGGCGDVRQLLRVPPAHQLHRRPVGPDGGKRRPTAGPIWCWRSDRGAEPLGQCGRKECRHLLRPQPTWVGGLPVQSLNHDLRADAGLLASNRPLKS